MRRVLEERALRPVTPNDNPDIAPSSVGDSTYTPGDPEGFVIGGDPATPSFGTGFTASLWDGWPAEWARPLLNGASRVSELADTAWAGIDLNASILATMPPYLVRRNEVLPSRTWMGNPDPDLYTSWSEFAKQLFWDYHLGEVFILPTAYDADNWPARFHVVRPWLINVEMSSGRRRYTIGNLDVTDEILHIRYQSTTDDAHGHGPLEAGAARVVAAEVLGRYATQLARGGGVPYYVLTHPEQLTAEQSTELLEQWWQSRTRNLGLPAVMSGGVDIKQLQLSPKDMALLDLAQFNEGRIAVMLGVPPFLLGLPSGGDSMTYSNVSTLFDYHWRAGLRPKAAQVMAALSEWLLPRGTSIELNRDEYVRPGLAERASAYAVLHGIVDADGTAAISAGEVREAERFTGDASATSNVLTGGT